jgi:rhodanese-related sulfurtransferase
VADRTDEQKFREIEKMSDKVSQPGVPELTADELRKLQTQEKIVLVDVRTPDEQVVSMIPGAITASDFEDNRQSYEGATVVTYCTIGGRSGKYAKGLVDAGVKAFNLRGAILAWTHAGGDLIDTEGPTRRVHVHGRKMNLTADGYEPVW